jgi:hypothetical protein
VQTQVDNHYELKTNDYVRIVPAVMALLTMIIGGVTKRAQLLSRSHYVKKDTARMSPIGGAMATSLDGIKELIAAVSGGIRFEVPRHAQGNIPDDLKAEAENAKVPVVSTVAHPNEHGEDYDLRVYVLKSEIDNFYAWLKETTHIDVVGDLIRECYEEMALESLDGYNPPCPALTEGDITVKPLGLYVDISESTNPDRGAAGQMTHYLFRTAEIILPDWALQHIADNLDENPMVGAYTEEEIQQVLDLQKQKKAGEEVTFPVHAGKPLAFSGDVLNMFDETHPNYQAQP